jgi:hypothetical protein
MRKLLFLLCLIPGLVLASDDASRYYVVNSFDKGLNSYASPTLTPENQAYDAEDVTFTSLYGALGKREPLLTAWDVGSATVTGLHRYYKSDGTIKTLIGTSTYLKIGDADATTTTTIAQGLSDSRRWSFATYQDIAIAMNGYDNALKYDGLTATAVATDDTRSAGDLCADLGAPFAQRSDENGGDDLDASSWYQYKMAFYDGSLYSYSNARSNPIQTGSNPNSNLTITGIPLGPSGTTNRYIYRTRGNSTRAAVVADSSVYMVLAIANNTVKTMDDNIADGTEPDVPSWATVLAGTNVTPPKGKYCELHKEHLFISGNNTYKSDIYYSPALKVEYFDPADYTQARPDDGDEVTFIKSHLGLLHVGKNNTIQKFYTDPPTNTDDAFDTNWTMSDPYSYVGSPAPYSVAVSPYGIIYATRDGIYIFNGQSSTCVSDSVQAQIDDIALADIANIVGYYHADTYYFAYTSTESGQSYHNKELVYNFNIWYLNNKNVNCYASFNAGTDLGTLYSGSATTDGVVFAHSGSSTSLSKRYKSEIDSGTFDDTRTIGTENASSIEIAWDCTIDGWVTELQTKDASVNTINDIYTYLPDVVIDRPDTAGTWTSPIYRIDAEALDTLSWNENLNTYGDVTWQIRLASTEAGITGASWETAVTDPNGSDVSGITANAYIQLRANLSTTDIQYTPTVYFDDGYLFRLVYTKVGAAYESAINSYWQSGWKDFSGVGMLKLIKAIKVYYTGESGTLTVNAKNFEGDIDRSFDINLATSPSANNNDPYTGTDDMKCYTYLPPVNSSSTPSMIGDKWMFKISDNGITDWLVKRIEVEWNAEEMYPY